MFYNNYIILFLQLYFSPDVSFATVEETAALRKNVEFNRYVLQVAVARMQTLPAQAEARHIKHSQSTFAQLAQITRIMYLQCVDQLAAISERFDVETAQLGVECFRECLHVAIQLYPRKVHQFLQTLSTSRTNN